MPACWRKRVWICLADHYVNLKHPKIAQTLNRVFSDRICPADESLGNQIVKVILCFVHKPLLSILKNAISPKLFITPRWWTW